MQEDVSGNAPVEQASQPEPNVQEQFIQAGQDRGDAQKLEQKPGEQKTFDEAFIRQLAREESAKVAQSYTDKASDRLTKYVAKQIDALETSRKVLGLSDEQVEAAKQRIVVDAITAKEPEPTTVPLAGDVRQVQPPTPAQPTIHPIVATALNMMKEAGVTIAEGDPEFEQFIKPNFSKPDVSQAFLLDTARAIDAKTARLAEQQENAAIRTAGGAPGNRVPADDISNITDSAELYRIGEKRLRERKR